MNATAQTLKVPNGLAPGIAALVLAAVAVFVPLIGTVLAWGALAIAIVAAVQGDRVFAPATVLLCAINFIALTPTLWLGALFTSTPAQISAALLVLPLLAVAGRAFGARGKPMRGPPLSPAILKTSSGGIGVVVGDGRFRFPVTGTSYHQRELERIAGGRGKAAAHHRCAALLLPQPDNAYDPEAVVVEIGGIEAGHLPHPANREFLAALHAAGYDTAACEAAIVGGWDRGDGDTGSFGLRLNACRPFRLITAAQYQRNR